MTAFEDAQRFIDASRSVRTQVELTSLMEAITRDMGFRYFALIHHVDVRSQNRATALWLENYPASWAEAFIAQELYASDPMVLASQRTNVGFAWSDVPKMIRLTDHHKRILLAVRREGLGDGFTVPAHVPGEANGSCNFAMAGTRPVDPHVLPAAHLVGAFAFQAARGLALRNAASAKGEPQPRLTPRQLDCVLHIARGKSEWEIATILGIKPDTVREYVRDACRRYGVTRRIQLAFRVVHDGQLALADIVR